MSGARGDGPQLAVLTIDRDRMIASWNPGAARLLGYPAAEMVGSPLTFMMPAGLVAEFEAMVSASLTGECTEARPFQLIRQGGEPVDIDLTATPVADARGQVSGACLVAVPRSATAFAPPPAPLGSPGLEATFESAPIGMALVSREGCVLKANRALSMLLGYTAPELLASTLQTLTNAADLGVELGYLEQLLAGRIRNYRLEKRFVAADGRDVWVSLSSSAVGDKSEPDLLLWQMEDLTGWKRTEEDLAHRALHDPLTDLPNRSLLMDRLSQALARSGRRQSSVAVLFIDLDHFKLINDELGHDVGDELLVTIAGRLLGVTRAQDTVARFAGDEFVMLCEDVEGEQAARAIGERVVRAVSTPLTVKQGEALTTASVGIAMAAGTHDRPEVLVEHADRAMYRAKSLGGSRYEVFSPERTAPTARLGGIAIELRRAVVDGELRLLYQPRVELDTGKIVGVEALLRWEHPQRGVLLPADFIPAAERTGLIVELGRWVLAEAIDQAVRWGEGPPITVSINVSTQELAQGDFASEVADALTTSGLSASSLHLEIAESAVLNTARLAPTWKALDSLGVRLHVDALGSTATSLRHLKGLPVDTVTIDPSFVAGLGTDSPDSAIVEAVVHMADALHLRSMGEGVETEEQAALLRSMGCTLGQGYYFARPLPPQAVEELIGKGAA
jgi:diguanylate cyclase (GGDEF)-like protein/PAS domain S-box-containing protein